MSSGLGSALGMGALVSYVNSSMGTSSSGCPYLGLSEPRLKDLWPNDRARPPKDLGVPGDGEGVFEGGPCGKAGGGRLMEPGWFVLLAMG